MKIIIIALLFLLMTNCNKQDQGKGQELYENEKKQSQYRTIKYYMKAGQVGQVPIAKLTGLVEYYKITLTNSDIRIKEEYFKNGRLIWYRTFHYEETKNKKPNLKTTTYYNPKKKITKEEIYQNGKRDVLIQYLYHPKKKYRIQKKHYKYKGNNTVPQGWWLQYDKHGNVIKKESYKQGKLLEYWLYKYDSQNKQTLEENYDNKGKLKHNHSYD